MALFAAVVALPIGFYGCQSEMARWNFAHARNLYDAGKTEEAIENGKKAISKSPKDLRLKLELSRWMMHNGKADEALPLIEEAVENAVPPTNAMMLKSDCLVHLGKPDEALVNFKRVAEQLSQSELQSPGRLNGLAYYRSLAGAELDRALIDIENALADLSDVWVFAAEDIIPFEDQVHVATAMVSRRVEKQSDVLPVVNDRITRVLGLLDQVQKENSAAVYKQMEKTDDEEVAFSSEIEKQFKKRSAELSIIRRSLSVLLSVRALLYQDLGDQQNCIRDRQQVDELGGDADQLLLSVPADWQCLSVVSAGASFIDTRGFVYAARKQYILAQQDFEIATLAAQVLNAAHDSEIFNSAMVDIRGDYNKRDSNRLEAVVLNHHCVVLDELGRKAEAAKNRARIRELGFEPGPHLF